MQLPQPLRKYQSKAADLLKKKKIGDIQFSGSTYQIQVIDDQHDEDCWVFLQVGDHYEIRDSFCSCESDDKGPHCLHVAAAYLSIFGEHQLPLHKRFKNSLWNQLCLLYADKMGYSSKELKQLQEGSYEVRSVSDKLVFELKAKTDEMKEVIDGLIHNTNEETEETSIKFSNLSQEELALWKEGRPTLELRYELSFWNDLAHLLFIHQELGKPYNLSFKHPHKELPTWLQIEFQDIEVGFYLSQASFPHIIPALTMVNSPYKVHGFESDGIKEIIYDQEKETLSIIGTGKTPLNKNNKNRKTSHAVQLDGWDFVPDDGFYAREPSGLNSNAVLQGHEIEEALIHHTEEIKANITGTKINAVATQVSYIIQFDEQNNLHISSYVLQPGDLTKPYSKIYGNWAYVQDNGFYRLATRPFDEVEVIVPFEQVSVFVAQHRSWLNTQEGFETHLVSIESHLTYELTEDNHLTFNSIVDTQDDEAKQIDFGRWIYVPGYGFYQKVGSYVSLPLRSGVGIPSEQISHFIWMNREELRSVTGFFSNKNPIIKAGLKISLNRYKHVVIEPSYELDPDYADKNVRLFGDYAYVLNEGFTEIPLSPKIREIFGCPLDIAASDTDEFIETQLKDFLPHTLELDPRLQVPKNLELVAEHIEKAGEDRHLQVKFAYYSDLGKVDAIELWKAIRAKRRYALTSAGLFDLNDERYNWLRYFSAKHIDKKQHLFFLTNLHFLRLNAFEEVHAPKDHQKRELGTYQYLKEITEFVVPEAPNLTGLESHLRAYQEVGVNWLWFLYHQQLSGLLCDDMGLGKTHQAMALLAAVTNAQIAEGVLPFKKHFLVICPTSVLYHWQEKLQNFLPHLKVCTFYGAKRSFNDFKSDYDLLLTSYGIWRNERDILKQVPFEVAIFDEVQAAKNHSSLLHASLLDVKAKMKIGLTGTPIENYLKELKSLFDIVLPTYMPSEADFNRFFARPIEKDRNQKRKNILSRFIKPFVLRRKKEDVLNDLPEKTEEIAWCDLSHQQVELYNKILAGERPRLMQELSEEKGPIPFVHVFAILSHLKQVCDHPAVYLQEAENYKKYHSGKWALFLELLHEARDSGQKVVVFSQYLLQLDIIQAYLKEQNIGFAEIRGSTTNRGEEVKRFQNDPTCEVFIASLQAAGLGIDLTAASVVIHYDRWWNAAKENQATDRVHRIGQRRGVQVFKLVTKGTFEEKINLMIAAKGELMEDVVGADDHQLLKQLDRNQILDLLRDVHVGKDDDALEMAEDEELKERGD